MMRRCYVSSFVDRVRQARHFVYWVVYGEDTCSEELNGSIPAPQVRWKVNFFLCKACSMGGAVQCRPCNHSDLERSWVDTYTLTDMNGALKVGYKVIKYYELWHYQRGGEKFFKDLILNIVRRKIECSGFPTTFPLMRKRNVTLTNYVLKVLLPLP